MKAECWRYSCWLGILVFTVVQGQLSEEKQCTKKYNDCMIEALATFGFTKKYIVSVQKGNETLQSAQLNICKFYETFRLCHAKFNTLCENATETFVAEVIESMETEEQVLKCKDQPEVGHCQDVISKDSTLHEIETLSRASSKLLFCSYPEGFYFYSSDLDDRFSGPRNKQARKNDNSGPRDKQGPKDDNSGPRDKQGQKNNSGPRDTEDQKNKKCLLPKPGEKCLLPKPDDKCLLPKPIRVLFAFLPFEAEWRCALDHRVAFSCLLSPSMVSNSFLTVEDWWGYLLYE